MRTTATIFAWLLIPNAIMPVSVIAEDPLSAKQTEFFEKEIRPILAERCYACHSVRSGQSEGGLLLDSRPGWQQGGDSGHAITPGEPDSSLLIEAVRYKNDDLKMPPDKALSERDVRMLEQWIRLGAPDPRSKPTEETSHDSRPSDPVAGRQHWAFRPLANQGVPGVEATDWPESAIDHYVLAKLEESGLDPVQDADRRSLMRRLYFQLTGLPPTPEQASSFLNDKRPDAVAGLVDTLLASPQFGERWGRHWLDLARYADSNGLDENFLFREAWRYRNNVITSFNEDKPFDQFLIEQIAGDLLPFDSISQRDRQRLAAGFMVIGPKVLLGNDPRERRMDVADEQIDTIGRAVLGQTLGCARCHDHKFDPIPTADYYALAGIMTSTSVMETRYMLGQQRMMEQLIGLGQNGNTADDAYEAFWREKKQRDERVAKATEALKILEGDDEGKLNDLKSKHKTAVAESAADQNLPKAERLAAQKELLALAQAAAKPLSIPPRGMIPVDISEPKNEAIRLAGRFDRKGDAVPRGFLQVISDNPPEIPADQSGRLQLAKWLTDVEQGAGRVTARVQVNRIWHHLVGRGIVRTVDNFGRTGETPSHPLLLDYLARQLIDHEWSIKAVIREIVLSRTFQLSSQHDGANSASDPDNILLWRANRRRLDPESYRDAMMMVAGTLDLTPMESTVSYLGDQATAVGANKNRRRTDFPCRSVYLPVIRNDLPELFDAMDFADPHATTGMRPETIVATQALFVLNNEMMMDAASATATRLTADGKNQTPTQFVRSLFRHAVNDEPDEVERQLLTSFLTNADKHTAADETNLDSATLALVCHALFASSRFQILE